MDENNNYVFIGGKIFSFKSYSQITDFVSQIGNSDVPYPVAIDSEQNHYLLIEDVVIKSNPDLLAQDAYRYYYSSFLITPDRAFSPPRQPLHGVFEQITGFLIGGQTYTFRYKPSNKAGSEYDRFLGFRECQGDPTIKIVKSDQSTQTLSRDDYIDLMRRFEEMAGFQVLINKVVIDSGFN